jgi:hypothetical protein
MDRQNELSNIVGTLTSSRCFACGLHGRQQQPNQNANDGYDH